MRRFALLGVIAVANVGCVEEVRTRRDHVEWCAGGVRKPQTLMDDVTKAHEGRVRDVSAVVRQDFFMDPFDTPEDTVGYADLDGDGVPDQIRTNAGGTILVDFGGTQRRVVTPIRVTEGLAGIVPHERPAAIVISSDRGARRYRWDGFGFVEVARLGDTFEAAYALATERERDVLDDEERGGFGRLHRSLFQCAISGPNASCRRTFDAAVKVLVHGGLRADIARDDLHAYLGWKICEAS